MAVMEIKPTKNVFYSRISHVQQGAGSASASFCLRLKFFLIFILQFVFRKMSFSFSLNGSKDTIK